MSGCKFYGEVNAATQFAGGIAGISGGVASIKSCMVSGEIEGVENCGGIIGKMKINLLLRIVSSPVNLKDSKGLAVSSVICCLLPL